ncbi:hypothetical protein [Thalassotalea piscium]|jgi:hypothetical protein|uniref:Uncharacterized protein n=1 Tax=Thalassotalea piscium TaxID=1230533 RepID=A0A7X0NKP0_9GAMM|nr:hypothetical protein [Thalassotalea piscium]MBB6545180.1 hypothetical protein [Thalassotalea piscium]
MITSINSQNYTVQQTQTNTNKTEETVRNIPKNYENTNNIDTRKNTLSFIETASPEELEAKVNSLTGRMPSMAVINLREIMNSENGDELVARIGRLQGQMDQEHRNVLDQEQNLISQGRAEGKSNKDILMSIVKMQDEQSELYKMSANWGSKGLTSPENYTKLVELTSNYVNYYA